MESMDNVRERFGALERQTEQLKQQTYTHTHVRPAGGVASPVAYEGGTLMRQPLLISLLLLSLILGGGQLAWPVSYDFTTIDVPNSSSTTPIGINNQGEIVGGFSDASFRNHGFLLSGGTFTTIDVPNSQGSEADRINDLGQIVGHYGDVSGRPLSFLLSGGTFTTIDVPNGNFTDANGINNQGQMVGTFSFGAAFHGFLLSGGTFTTIDVPNSFSTVVEAINDRGQIVGGFVDANRKNVGFLLSGGTFTTIDIPNSTRTSPNGINNQGEIVGVYVDANGGEHGFLLSGGTFTTIDVPNSVTTDALGINDRGQIVGLYVASGRAHGFLATPSPVTPFAAFTATVEIELGPRRDDAFTVQSRFTLGAGSNGIDPLTENVTLELTGGTGTFTTTIPAGSFTKDEKGRFEFEGTINGVALQAKITPLGGKQFAYKVEGEHADLTGIANPATVTLIIGNDRGSTTVIAKFEKDHDDRDKDNRHDGDRDNDHRDKH